MWRKALLLPGGGDSGSLSYALSCTIQDSTHTSIYETSVITLEMRELLVQLARAIIGVKSAPLLTPESVPATIMET